MIENLSQHYYRLHLLLLVNDPPFCIRNRALMGKGSFRQCIFVDRAILHDDEKVFARVFDKLEIL
jgi:hypothetical protein